MIHSDWHIHSEASYDATETLEHIAAAAEKNDFRQIGITDHLNYNDDKFIGDLKRSAEMVTEFQKTYPKMVLGVELTPIALPEFNYIAANGTRDGYEAPMMSEPYGLELALTKEELKAYGVRYAIGASHWNCGSPRGTVLTLDESIREWYRQQIWLANDERVTVLGHPWWHSKGLWYEDFTVIPHSMNMDIAALLKQNGKYVECNTGVLYGPLVTEKYRYQYAEFLRELFEMGIPVTYGSDSHHEYRQSGLEIVKVLESVGFKDGDFSEISEDKFW